jgi:ribonuclease R
MKFAEFLEDKIFSTYTATIYVVASFGFFVQLNNTIQGLVSIKTLEGNYIYNEKNGTLSSEDNKIVYSLGKKVNVQLIYTNKETRRIEFKII